MQCRTTPHAIPVTVTRAVTLLFLSAFLTPAFSQQEPPPRGFGKLWKVSLVALAGATTVDAVSSWNRPEANPILRNSNGQFNAQGVGIKIGLVGTMALAQYFLVRKAPRSERAFAVANFAAAGAFGVAAIHNWSSVPAAPAASAPPGTVAVQ